MATRLFRVMDALLFIELAKKRVPEDVGRYRDALAIFPIDVCLVHNALHRFEQLHAGGTRADAGHKRRSSFRATFLDPFLEYLPGVGFHRHEITDAGRLRQYLLKSPAVVLVEVEVLKSAENPQAAAERARHRGMVVESLISATAGADAERLRRGEQTEFIGAREFLIRGQFG
jgi:hypothetical protein